MISPVCVCACASPGQCGCSGGPALLYALAAAVVLLFILLCLTVAVFQVSVVRRGGGQRGSETVFTAADHRTHIHVIAAPPVRHLLFACFPAVTRVRISCWFHQTKNRRSVQVSRQAPVYEEMACMRGGPRPLEEKEHKKALPENHYETPRGGLRKTAQE